MLDLGYRNLNFAEVSNVTGFFKELSKERLMKVKSMFDNIKISFGINKLNLQIAEGADIYKFTILSKDHRQYILGEIVYMPSDKRLDVWVTGEFAPLIQFKNKKVVYKNYSEFMDYLGFDRIFDRLVNVM
jgi:hypothetical protein